MFKWFLQMSKSKSDRRFEILDERLIDMQDRLRKLAKAITNLDRKVELKMSELSDAVQAIKDDVVRIGTGVKAILDKLQQPNPDVAAATAALKEADAGLDAVADSMDAALNPSTPAP